MRRAGPQARTARLRVARRRAPAHDARIRAKPSERRASTRAGARRERPVFEGYERIVHHRVMPL